MSTLAETAIVLKRLSAAYGQTVTGDQARAYNYVVGMFPRLDLAAAALDVMSENKFFPRPAELRAKLIERKTKGLSIVVHNPDDERCMWRMFELGITDPDDLSEEEVRKIFGQVDLFSVAVPE